MGTELFERLPSKAVLNIDETGHKENGEKFWMWCFRAGLDTQFRIDPTNNLAEPAIRFVVIDRI